MRTVLCRFESMKNTGFREGVFRVPLFSFPHISLHCLVLFLLIIIAPVFIGAEPSIGSISFMEGRVEIFRGEHFFSSDSVNIGFPLEMFDTIETGNNGYAEVSIDLSTGSSSIKIGPKTTFYLEGPPRKSSFLKTTFQLLRGVLSLKVDRLSQRESYAVQTDSALMAVRGTAFSVDMALDRSVLVAVTEGKIQIKSGTREKRVIPTNTVATIDENAAITSARVNRKEISQYREKWNNARMEALQINAGLSIKHHASLWDRLYPQFKDGMRELNSHGSIFKRWDDIERGKRKEPATAVAIRDKQAVSKGMLALRASLPIVERTFYALLGLEEAYLKGLAPNPFKDGKYADAAEFYEYFRRDVEAFRMQLSVARQYIRAHRSIEGAIGSLSSSGLMDGLPHL